MELSDPIRSLRGIGPKTEKLFHRLSLYTLEDLLLHFPCRYTEYPPPLSKLPPQEERGNKICLRATLKAPLIHRFHNRRSLTEGWIETEKERILVRWYNSPYLRATILPGKPYIFLGSLSHKRGSFYLEHPIVHEHRAYEELAGTLGPVYRTTAGLGQNKISRAVAEVLEYTKNRLSDYLTTEQQERLGLLSRQRAIISLHFPSSGEELPAARKRLAFDEFFLFLYNIREAHNASALPRRKILEQKPEDFWEMERILPYQLTGDQKVTIAQLWNEICLPKSMHRLLQGDVGSGKTVVAAFCMYLAFKNRGQSVMMVPTEVLAGQHYDSLQTLFAPLAKPPRIALLTGSLSKGEQREVYRKSREGEIDILIGTHALIEEGLGFKNLLLVITDEQHRFGVLQRQRLAGKGEAPHVLVMSATPIPRTLALILYGDLDISILQEKPGGRLSIKNAVIAPADRNRAYRHIERELRKGHQAYMICAMVEESEHMDAENVTEYAENLSVCFPPSVRIGVLHGRMKEQEKRSVMEGFKKQELDILVSTTVIEVGVDVPNATVIMIEDAQRFGLATLHQLRGRVGRGHLQSYCILVRTSDTESAKRRLEILASSNDGFYLAEEDLKLRGGGELLGLAQSGDLFFSMASLYEDRDMLSLARDFLRKIKEDGEESLSGDFPPLMETYRLRTARQLQL